jgi:hypothetical protein
MPIDLIFNIIGAAISAAGVVVPEVDRIAARREQVAAVCSCNDAMVRRIVAEELARRNPNGYSSLARNGQHRG